MQGIKLLKMEAKQSLMVNNMIIFQETHEVQLKNKKKQNAVNWLDSI